MCILYWQNLRLKGKIIYSISINTYAYARKLYSEL